MKAIQNVNGLVDPGHNHLQVWLSHLTSDKADPLFHVGWQQIIVELKRY